MKDKFAGLVSPETYEYAIAAGLSDDNIDAWLFSLAPLWGIDKSDYDMQLRSYADEMAIIKLDAAARKDFILEIISEETYNFCRIFVDDVQLFKDAKKLRELSHDRREIDKTLRSNYTQEVREQVYYNGKFQHHLFADWLTVHYHIARIDESVHVYQNGVYRQGQRTIEQACDRILHDLKSSQRKEVVSTLDISSVVPDRKRSKPYFVPLKTKVFDILRQKFMEYSPDFVFLNRLPYDYDPLVEPQQRIIDFFDKLTDGDEDVQKLLFEFIGSCLFFENDFRGSLFLVSDGGTGKSTFLNLVARLIGDDNSVEFHLQELQDKFRVGSLYGKALAVADDMSSQYIETSNLFKAAITGGSLKYEAKGQMPWEFKPYCSFIFCMNELPTFNDRSKGLYDRLLIVPLEHNFRDASEDVAFKNADIWTEAEMQYLLKLAIDGLQRLIRQGKFTQPLRCVKALEEFKADNDPVIAFFREYYPDDVSFNGKWKGDIYEQYTRWATANGFKPMSSNNLTRRIKKQFRKVICSRHWNSVTRQTDYLFVKLY